jgi:uncharacterized membrane protein (UPF0127 family)
VAEVTVGDNHLRVWVADEPAERSQGLRGFSELPDDIDGMLFVFPEPVVPTFVMDDTSLALDLWLFDESGELVGSEEMLPCAGEGCPRYPAPESVSWALETPLDAVDLRLGDSLSTSDFP